MSQVYRELIEEAEQQPEGSRAKKLLTWASVHFADSADRIAELEREEQEKDKELESLRNALHSVKALLETVGKFCADKAFMFDTEQFGRDMVGHINIMGAHGDPDYLKSNGMSIRHVDLRTKKPRTKKQ